MAAAKKSDGQGKLAVIVTGAAGRAAALLGALQALEASEGAPDVLVGASGGAVAAALYAVTGDAATARDALYELVASHSWQELADIDFAALRLLTSRPHEVPGFFKGEALFDALRSTPLGQKGFQHTAKPLFILATELNLGEAMVFGAQTRDELGENPPYQVFARSAADLERVNVAAACRASLAVPGLFEPVSLDHYCLVDGTLRQRAALQVAAAQEGVSRILWLHAGLDDNDGFSLVCDYAGQSFAAALLQALTVAAADTFDPHTADPILADKAVRFVNLASASVGAAELSKTQQLYESGRRSLTALHDTLGGLFAGQPAAAAAKLATVTDEVEGARWVTVVGAGAKDILSVSDRTPSIQREFGYEFDAYLEQAGIAKLAGREPVHSAAWGGAQAQAQIGLWALAALYLSRGLGLAWKGVVGLLKVLVKAIRLDQGLKSLAAYSEKLALQVGDSLRRQPPTSL